MKAAIFDMDGTLVNSMYYWRTVALELLRAQGFEPPAELCREIYYNSVRAMPPVMRSYCDIALSDAEMNRFFDERMALHYENDVTLKPDADKYIAALRAEGIICALATASQRAQVLPLMRKTGLLDMFYTEGRELIFCSNEMGMTKASDEYYPELCRRIGFKPDECVMYEDALYSIKTAKRAGLTVWAIEDETAKLHKAEIMRLADRYFTSWSELI